MDMNYIQMEEPALVSFIHVWNPLQIFYMDQQINEGNFDNCLIKTRT